MYTLNIYKYEGNPKRKRLKRKSNFIKKNMMIRMLPRLIDEMEETDHIQIYKWRNING